MVYYFPGIVNTLGRSTLSGIYPALCHPRSSQAIEGVFKAKNGEILVKVNQFHFNYSYLSPQ